MASRPNITKGAARLNRLIDLNAYPIQPVLRILLKDRTTGENIIWATNNYEKLGNTYHSAATMRLKDLVKLDKSVIQPRVYKTLELQKQRTKVNAEVFTPSWICCLMNNHLDDIWFGRKDVFNKMKDKSWRATNRPIEFPVSGSKTWQGYVDSRRIEITCGEAPYLVSRYDTTTGKVIPISHRIGILDRKLRVVNENAENEAEWIKWTLRAYQATYGYEYQGDNLLIARSNMLMTFVDYMQTRWERNPTEDELKAVAFIISWNVWQMNGLTYKTSYDADADRQRLQQIIDECDATISTYTMCARLPDENYLPTLCDLQLSKEYTLQELIDLVKQEDEISLAYMYAEMNGLKIAEEDKRDFDAEIKQARSQLEETVQEMRLIRDETHAEKCMIADAPDCLIKNWRMRRTERFRDIAQKNKGKGIMKFDFTIGNPPYQDGKQQIYPAFYQSGKEIAQCVEMIFPVGWQEPKNANGLKKMNTKEVKEDPHIVFINNVEDVFPSVSGAKYTNIILWDRNHDNKLNGCQKILTNGENPQTIKLLCDASDIKLPSELTSALDKVKANNFIGIDTIIYIQNNLILDVVYEDYPEVEALIGSEGRDKRFERNIFDKLPAFTENQQAPSDIKTIGTVGNKRTWRYINEKYVDKTHANLKKYKLIISAAASDKFGSSLSDFIIGKPNEAYTRSFIGFGAYSSDVEVRNIEKYLKTKFARALLYTLKSGRMNNKDVWQNVPLQDFTKDADIDWSQSISEIDQQLYKKYGLSQEEIDFIETKVKEME